MARNDHPELYSLTALVNTTPSSMLSVVTTDPWHPEVIRLFAHFVARYEDMSPVRLRADLLAKPEPTPGAHLTWAGVVKACARDAVEPLVDTAPGLFDRNRPVGKM